MQKISEIILQWIPNRCWIAGNKIADHLANIFCLIQQLFAPNLTTKSIKQLILTGETTNNRGKK